MKPVKEISQRQVVIRTVLSFTVFIVLGFAGWKSWRYLYHQKPDKNDAQIHPTLRKVAQVNERVFGKAFSSDRPAKTYTVEEAVPHPRVNGNLGIQDDDDTTDWQLSLVRNPGDTIYLSLADIKALPKTDVIFNFKCIEGWNQITHWGGTRFVDFIKAYHLEAQAKKKYIGLITPDGGYYVGIDMPSALQMQTILCYEMNGNALPVNQGYPLRLIIPVKYGIKHLKRIGTLFFSNTPPPDYWAEQGYDYYSGH